MTKSKSYILLGAGGHAKVLYEILKLHQLNIQGFIAPEKTQDLYFEELEYLGDDATFDYESEHFFLVNTLGSVKYTQPRENLYQYYKTRNFSFPKIIHPSAIISHSAKLLEGVQLLAGSIINSCAIIKENSIINTGAIIEHDCCIGSHNHIAPRAVLCGNVSTGSNVHIGAGASINQSIHIGHNVIIASGAVVTENIPDNSIVAGVPAVSIK